MFDRGEMESVLRVWATVCIVLSVLVGVLIGCAVF